MNKRNLPVADERTNPAGMTLDQKIAFERERLDRVMCDSIPHRKAEHEGKAVLQLSFEEIERLRVRVLEAAWFMKMADWALKGRFDRCDVRTTEMTDGTVAAFEARDLDYVPDDANQA